MTSPVSESCRPSPTGVGGAFYALLCALAGHCRGARRFSLCVFLAPLCVLSTLVFPPLTALYIRKALSGQDTSFSIGRTLKERLALFLKMEGVYLCLLIAALAALGAYLDALYSAYYSAAAAISGLQLGTKAQGELASALNLALGVFILGLLLIYAALFALTLCVSEKSPAPLREARGLWFMNLPGLILISALFTAVLLSVEKYYAHLRMLALEAIVLQKEYFDPSLWFILMRVYLISSALVALTLLLAMSLGLIKNRSLKINP